MADFRCTFAEAPFAYPTQEVLDYIDKNISLDDFRLTVPARNWPGAATDVTYPLNNSAEKPGLYKLNYPSSSVSKWGEFWGLISGEHLATMLASGDDTLYMQTEDTEMQWSCILAAAMPICEMGSNTNDRIISAMDEDTTLHLGLFVDERFFIANYSSTLSKDLGCDTSWSTLITNLMSDCGIFASVPAISGAYGSPSEYSDLIECGQYNAAVMLDGAMLNCGLNLIRDLDGTYTCSTYSTCSDTENTVDYSNYHLRAGGDWSRNTNQNYLSTLPESCTFHFPIWIDEEEEWYRQSPYVEDDHLRSPLNSINYYTLVVSKADAFTAAGLTNPTSNIWSGASKVFRETARAHGSPPTNLAGLTAMSLKLSADFFTRKYWSLRNEVWNLLLPPSGSGWFTYIYHYGQDCKTVVVADYANHDVEQLMHDWCEELSSSSSSSSSSETSSSETSSSETSSSETSSLSSSSLCYNPFNDLDIIEEPTYVLGKNEEGCLGWVEIAGCNESSGAP